MKETILLILAIFSLSFSMAQNAKNERPDAIVGTYSLNHGGFQSKVRVYKMKNGTYNAQCIWLKDSIDPKTNKLRTDEKNPDKSLRNVPCNRAIIINGLKYNAEKKCWDGAKIYDPTRGIKANCFAEFAPDGRLKVRGQLMGVGETIYWTLIK